MSYYPYDGVSNGQSSRSGTFGALMDTTSGSKPPRRDSSLRQQDKPNDRGFEDSPTQSSKLFAGRMRAQSKPLEEDSGAEAGPSNAEGTYLSGGSKLLDLTGKIEDAALRNITRCGGGGFGDVYRLQHAELGDIAMKRVREVGDQIKVSDERRRARREAEIWHSLQHPNVLRFIGVYETPFHFFFVSPFAKNGTIVDYVTGHPEVDRIALVKEAATGLAYLHQKQIIHGDVKAANVLVSDDVHALICDFGMTRNFDTATSTAFRGAGSVRWMSPEVLIDGGGRTAASDVWGFAMMTSEVLSGNIPFVHLPNDHQVVRAVIDQNLRPSREPAQSASGLSYRHVWEIVAACWNKDPSARPTMETVRGQLLPRNESSVLLNGHRHTVEVVIFSPDSRLIASAASNPDNSIRLWDISTAEQIGKPLSGHRRTVRSLAFAPDSHSLVSGSEDCTLRIWDLIAEPPKARRIIKHMTDFWAVAFSPDGRLIASGSSDPAVRLWDVASGACVSLLEGHLDWVGCVTFSPDGQYLASGADDFTIRIWDLATGKQKGVFMVGHTDWLWELVFSPDGQTLASGSEDGSVILWSPNSCMPKGRPLIGRPGYGVAAIAYSPDGTLLASASRDQIVRLWDVTGVSPKVLLELSNGSESVTSVAFSRNGRWLACGEDRSVRMWDLEKLLVPR